MIDLTDLAGLPIYLDEETGDLIYDDCVHFEQKKEVKLDDLIPVLLNKYLKYPEQIYFHFKNIFNSVDRVMKESGISYDLVEIPFGLLGIEYLKTHIYYTKPAEKKFSCIIQIVNGEITVIMQRNSDEQVDYYTNTLVDEVEIIKLQKGDRLSIPSGYFYTFINTGMEKAVFSMICSKNMDRVDYSILQKEKGLAFYIISKNARLEVVANPKYKIYSKPVQKAWSEYNSEKKKKFCFEETKHLKDNAKSLYDVFKKNLKVLEEALVF